MRLFLAFSCLVLLAGGCTQMFQKDQPATAPATAPAGPKYPDDPTVPVELRQLAHIDHVALLEEALKVYRTTPVRDYTCTFAKQERIDSSLGKQQVTRVRFLNKPFAVAMTWTKNPPRGDALIYVDGWWKNKDGKSQMLVRPTSSFLRAIVGGSILRLPDGPDARKASLRPVTVFGLENMIQNLLDVYREALRRGLCQMRYDGVATVGGRKCIVLRRILPPDMGYPAEVTEIFLDVETLMPLRVVGYDLAGQLLVDYSFTDVQYNVGLMLADFVPQANGIDPPKDLEMPDVAEESSPDETLAKPADVFHPANLQPYLDGRDLPDMTPTQPTSTESVQPATEQKPDPTTQPTEGEIEIEETDQAEPVSVVPAPTTTSPEEKTASTQPVDQPSSLPAVVAAPLTSNDSRPNTPAADAEKPDAPPAVRPAAVATSKRRGADLIPSARLAQTPAAPPVIPAPTIEPQPAPAEAEAQETADSQDAPTVATNTPAEKPVAPAPAVEPQPAPAEATDLPGDVGIFCKLRIIRVQDGKPLASANSIALSQNLRQLARRSVRRLKTAIDNPDQPVAVLQLRHEADTPAGANIAATLAREITLALVEGKDAIDVVEWIRLQGLAPAELWDDPAVLTRPAVRDQLQDVVYVIVGSISASGH
jgi:hypothetical protein